MKLLTHNLPQGSDVTPTKQQTRILLVEDHPFTRAGLLSLITQEADLSVCGEAETAVDAMRLLRDTVPDLAIVEIVLNRGCGVDLIKELRDVRPDMPILVVSMHDEALYAQRAIRAGAQGYVMKTETGERVVAAIRSVLAGSLFVSEMMSATLLLSFANAKRGAAPRLPLDALSDREREVFRLLGTGSSTREVAAQLRLSVKTIDSYREHLKLKLGLQNSADLIRNAIHWRSNEAVLAPSGLQPQKRANAVATSQRVTKKAESPPRRPVVRRRAACALSPLAA